MSDQVETIPYNASGGMIGNLSYGDVSREWLSLQNASHKFPKKEDMPGWLFPAVLKILKSGKIADQNALRGAISQACVTGKNGDLLFNSTTYGETLVKGEQFTADSDYRYPWLIGLDEVEAQ